MLTVNRGAPVLIEIEFRITAPFGAAGYFDPASAFITIKDPSGAARIDSHTLTKQTTGKWYYICQTVADWTAGVYTIEAQSSDGVYSNTVIEPKGFYLK